MKVSNLIAVAAIATFGFAPKAFAFHDGGVAYCDGCHTMHNSAVSNGGTGVDGAVAKKGASTRFQGVVMNLLQGSDDSSTCLNCHASAATGGYHIMTFPAPTGLTAPVNRTPGGDFAWLTQTFTGVTTYGAPYTSKGERHGHNIVAADYGLIADTILNTTSPGGSYPAGSLSCASCHDPHSRARIVDANGTIAYNQLGAKTLPISGSGSYGATPTATEAVGVYRLLAGLNYTQDTTGFVFTQAGPPVAVAPAVYNRTELATDTRVAYGTGMSQWCANCHAAIHNNVADTGTAFIHPNGPLAVLTQATTVNGVGTTQAGIYNAYVKSGDLTNTQATSYTSLVPFEEGTAVIATLLTHSTSTGGPTTGTENVMCLTCHRAHAGGFDSMTRWQNRGEFLTIAGAWPGSDAAATEGKGAQYSNGMTQGQYSAAMYDRPATNFATYQRSLCNKCHAKD